MNRFKSLFIGIGVAIFNFIASFMQVFKPERCTGSCGSCGLACAEPVVGLVSVGVIVIVWRKLKVRFKKLKHK
ncbi:MAG: hypothetical protein Q8936_06080 [Bacillota bacterium]|nr:hypothetical protein [Bacillota bacterium]